MTCWELICHKSETKDIVMIFSLSRAYFTLSKRVLLWITLMRRDFPEHFCKNEQCEKWYKDLYQYGAYFGVRRAINLYPEKILYIAMEDPYNHAGFGILTSRVKTGFTRCWLRFPEQNFIGLLKVVKRQKTSSTLNNSYAASVFETDGFNAIKRNFVRSSTFIYGLTKLKKYTNDDWKSVVEWIHKHFKVNLIDWQTGDITFYGELKDGYDFSFVTETPYDNNGSVRLRRSFYSKMLRYQISGTPGNNRRISCLNPHSTFNRINGQPIVIPVLQSLE
jgi:hypothetical protein